MTMLTLTRIDIVEAARLELGTPFHHQGRQPGVGIDCVGLLVMTARHLGIPHIDCIAYGRRPDGVSLEREISKSMVRIDVAEAMIGDAVCFRVGRDRRPRHVGILTDYGMIHTHQGVGRVVEHVLGPPWSDRIVSAWRFPGVE